MMRTFSLFLFIAICFRAPLSAQALIPWLDIRVEQLRQQAVGSDATGQMIANGKGTDKQKTSVASDPSSASLVDTSSATDFLSVASNLIPTGSSSSNSAAQGSGTATVSAYALLAAANHVGPTDPVFYRNHQNVRRVSLTAGTAASTAATDNSSDPATVVGAKVVIVNEREIFKSKYQGRFTTLNTNMTSVAIDYAQVDSAIRALVVAFACPNQGPASPCALNATGPNFGPTILPTLPPELLKAIDGRLRSVLGQLNGLQDQVNQIYTDVSTAPQLSAAYSGNIRKSTGYNDHHGEVIFDYGAASTLNLTINAAADYTDRKGVKKDSTGGDFAVKLAWTIVKTPNTSTKSSMTFDLSGKGAWLTAQKPQYVGQANFTIPLTGGIDFPIGYRYENRAAQLDKSNSQAQLGLSFDIGKLTQLLKGQ